MWKPITGLEDRYEIHIDGKIRNKKTLRELTPKIDKYGYCTIGLRRKGTRDKCWFSIHRLVALHFIESLPSSLEGLQVDHIDHNKTNNSVTNLRLVTPTQNCLARQVKSWNTNTTTGELYISKIRNGFLVRVNRSDYKFCKWFDTLDTAILCRDKILEEIHALGS